MGFDETRVRLYSAEVAVEYVDNGRDGIVALRITVPNASYAANKPIDLAETGHVGRGDGFGSPLPELDSGTLTFSEASLEADGPVIGEFDAVFVTGSENKLTVFGAFDTTLEPVELQ